MACRGSSMDSDEVLAHLPEAVVHRAEERLQTPDNRAQLQVGCDDWSDEDKDDYDDDPGYSYSD